MNKEQSSELLRLAKELLNELCYRVQIKDNEVSGSAVELIEQAELFIDNIDLLENTKLNKD